MSNKPKKNRAAGQFARTSGGVVVAYLHPVGEVAARFCTSLINLLVHDMHHAGHIVRHGAHMELSSGANITTARNKMVRRFLEIPSRPEWLWWLDSDMTFEPDTLDRLMETANPKTHPIVGGLCFALMKGEQQEIQPTLYGMTQGQTMSRWHGFPRDQVVQVVGTGSACILIHRTVLEAIRDLSWDDEFERKFLQQSGGVPSGRQLGEPIFPPPWPWYQEMVTGTNFGDSISEDLTFCLRAAQAGFPIHVDTRVKIGHQKPVVIDEDAYWKALPPADDEPAPTYVVIPVKGKVELTTAILRQLQDQGGCDGIFVYDNASGTPDALAGTLELGANPLPVVDNALVYNAAGKNIHEMWNMGIKEALSRNPRCNIAILNNDLILGEQFLERMAKGLRAHPMIAAVCGNYDNREFVELVQPVKGIAAGRQDGTGGFAGFAFMVKGEIFASGCPMFDEQYEIWYGDNDFTLMLDQAEAVYGIVRDAHVEHIGGGSQTAGDGKGSRLTDDLKAAAERDRERFVKKWTPRRVEQATARPGELR